MKTEGAVLVAVIFLLITALMLSPSCTKEIGTETPPTTPTEPETVTFPDENLDAAIREHLGKAPGEDITAAELATLSIFTANDRGITDLSGLEYCSNLTELHLYNNKVSALSSFLLDQPDYTES